jgi:hypothetical protein
MDLFEALADEKSMNEKQYYPMDLKLILRFLQTIATFVKLMYERFLKINRKPTQFLLGPIQIGGTFTKKG